MAPNPSTPWQIFVRSALTCGFVGVIFFGLTLKRIDPLPLTSIPPQFNGDRAHEKMRVMAKTYPYRLPWHENRLKAAEWIKGQFSKLGYSPQEMTFSEVIAGKHYTDLKNIYVEKTGKTHPDEIIAVMAHLDTAENTIEGAMDDASGVGVVLELAEVLANIPTERTILFLITDSEEFGAFWGARTFANSYPRAKNIVATANFDFVAVERQIAILTLCDGLKEGYTPLWLREMALNSIRAVGTVEARDMMNVVEFVQRALLIPPADHGAFLEAGIPAFNWVGQTRNFAYLMKHFHHTKHDVAESLLPQSFWDYGRAAEILVRSIDALPAIPSDFRNSSYWKITSRLYLDGWSVTVLHILAFVPFLFYSVRKIQVSFKNRSKTVIARIFWNECKNFGILLGSFLIGYALLRLMPDLNIITQYENFPATQKSLILYNPNYLAIGLMIFSIVAVYFALRRTFYDQEDDTDYGDLRQSFHAIFIATVIFLAFVKNSYLAVLLLLPPAYLWTFLRARVSHSDRVLNTLLLLGGAITFIVMMIVMSTVFHVGVVYWYMFLASAYGLISAYSVVLFFVMLTIMIRLFRSFIYK